MTNRTTLALLACFSIAGSLVTIRESGAQAAPFTIRRPPDGSVVREKVRIEIPRSSIKAGAFVAIYLDDEFQGALIPDDRASERNKPFTYIWDTKASKTTDGAHTVRAILYEPAAGSSDSVSSQQKAESAVRQTNTSEFCKPFKAAFCSKWFHGYVVARVLSARRIQKKLVALCLCGK